MGPKRVPLNNVARRVGMLTGTVSMVLNAKPSVAVKTRTHVQQVIDELGHAYKRSGEQLRSKRTGIVGVSICNLGNLYFAKIAVGIEEALDELRLAPVLGHCGESVAQQAKFLNTARGHNVEGLIVMPAIGTTRAVIEGARAWRIPLVLVSRYNAGTATDYAGRDNHAGIGAGHRTSAGARPHAHRICRGQCAYLNRSRPPDGDGLFPQSRRFRRHARWSAPMILPKRRCGNPH